AADDVASAVAGVAMGAPIHGVVEVGGPERFRLDDLARRVLGSRNDPREVISDPNARYFGARLSERSLVPADHAPLGATRFEDWARRSQSAASPIATPR